MVCKVFTDLNFSRYQLLILFLLYPVSYPFFAANQIFPVFANAKPAWICHDSQFSEIAATNCTIFESCQNLSIITNYKSVVSELGLVCDDGYYASLISSLQMIGLVIGNVVFGQVSDTFGRKPALLIGVIGLTIASSASTFCDTWESIGALRFLSGFFIGGYTVGINTLVMEILPSGSQRLFSRAIACMWGEARMVYALVAYLTRDWRMTFQVINFATLPPLLLIILGLTVESPRWLHAKGKNKRLESAQNWITIVNGFEDTEFARNFQTSTRVYTYRDLFSSPEIRKRTALCAFIWFSCTFISYGLDIQSGDLPGDRFTNQFIISGLISLAKPCIFFVDAWCPGFNRRLLHQISIGIPILCIAIAALLLGLAASKIGLTILSIIGLVTMEYQFDVAYLYCMELFPTVVRSVGLAFSNIVGRFGNVIAPQAVYLQTFWKPAPLVLFASLGLVVLAISIAFLPDTKRKPLPDTLDFSGGNIDRIEAEPLRNEDGWEGLSRRETIRL